MEPKPEQVRWVDVWSRTPLSTTVTLASTETQATQPSRFEGQTYRLIVLVTAGGPRLRLQVSNRFGVTALRIGAVHVALRKSRDGLWSETDRVVTFSGRTSVTLAPEEERWSDPVELTLPPFSDVAISLYLPEKLTPTAFHPTGLKTSYVSPPGNFCSWRALPPPLVETTMVFFVSRVQVASASALTLVTLGDSITDGACSDTDANGSWPDLLARRLASERVGAPISVVNAGIGSNRFAASDGAGLRGLARLAEWLSHPQVTWVIVLEGINDISYEHLGAAELIAAYQRAIAQAHEVGVSMFGVPLLPMGGSVKDVGNNEATRSEVNAWIRQSGAFDAVLDLEPVLADPSHPGRMRRELTEDFVHPNQAGYRAIAQAIDLSLFRAGRATKG